MLAGLDPRLVVSVDSIMPRDASGAKARYKHARKKLALARRVLKGCTRKKSIARWNDVVMARELEVACCARNLQSQWPEPQLDIEWENAQDQQLTALNACRSAREVQKLFT